MGYHISIVTGGDSVVIEKSLLSLGVTKVYLKSSNKEEVLLKHFSDYQLNPEETIYIGDDIPDYNVMKICGLSACPKNSAVEICEISDYISPFNGGEGCVRDIIEKTLRLQGKWFIEGALQW
jgi:3-deoxy-D-manno-octulosonate 8-phosphate phosphatase (KDO 8-P phosphatase)